MRHFWDYTGDDPELRDSADSVSRNPSRRLVARLRQCMVHVTSIDGYCGIRRVGAIRPNDGSRPETFPQSSNSYARRKNAVALFDFAGATDEQMLSESWKYFHFFTHHKPATIVLHLRRPSLKDSVIGWEQAKADVGYKCVWIPYVEVWHVGDLPAYLIDRVTVVRAGPVRYRTLPARASSLEDIPALISGLWPRVETQQPAFTNETIRAFQDMLEGREPKEKITLEAFRQIVDLGQKQMEKADAEKVKG